MGADGEPGDGFDLDRLLGSPNRRDFLKWAGGAAAYAGLFSGGGAFLAACGGGQSSGSQATATPKKGGHVTEGWANELKTFNSILSSDVYSNLCIGLCFDPLLNIKANGDLVPQIATAVPSAGSDQNTYEFKIRPNIRWSDGQPLTSEDVLFTYQLIHAPEYAAVASPRRSDFTQHVATISAPDPQTFVIKTKAPYGPLLATHGTYGILPKHILGNLPAAAINTADFNTAPPVANGAFKLTRWDKGSQAVFERNPLYYAGQARLDRYVYKVVPNTVAVGNQLKTGEIDAGQLDYSQVSSMQSVQGIDLVGFDTPSFGFFTFQLDPSKPAGQIFQDVKVRQALLTAIDRNAIVKTVLYGQGKVANSVETPLSWAYNPNTKPTYSYDPDRANKMLEQAGWVKGPDGIRAKNGRKLQFTIQGIAGSLAATNTMQVMQQNWKAVGVDLTPKSVQFAQLVTTLTGTHDFDLILIGFNWTPDPDESQVFSSSGTGPGGFNGFDFKDAEIDRLLADAANTIDRGRRKQLYAQYQNRMAELVPAPILYFQRWTWGLNQRLQGYGLGPFNQYGNRPWMKDVWVADSK